MIHNFDTMRDLIKKLNYYTKFYDEGKSLISDKEWDDMYFQLQELEKEFGVILSNSPTAKVDYQVVNTLQKVKHNHPMLSLDKTKSEDEVVGFLSGHDAIAMAKMDGLTCSIKYLNGTLVSAETRGNGQIGEDITHNIIHCKGVPLEIPIKDEVIIDGEVICTYDDFKEFSDEFANPRNFAAGSIRLLDANECAKRKLTFIAWDCIKGLDSCEQLNTKLYELNKLGFIIVPYLIFPSYNPANKPAEEVADKLNIGHVRHAIFLIKDWAQEFSYPIDGIVFKYNNCKEYQEAGVTSHHPKSALAYKFYDEEYESELLNIEYTMGKTGQITPVAIFKTLEIDGTQISKASLHNLNIMKQTLGPHPFINQKIKVVKQNQIIPQVVWGESIGDRWILDTILDIPTICPICGEKTTIKGDFLYCENPNCEGKFLNQLKHFTSKKGLDIKGLSEATLQKLINWEWITCISDIFKLNKYKEEWYKKDGFGIKSVDNILTAIEQAKDCELWQFISALSIPLIGNNYAKEICKQESDWNSFYTDINNNFNFTKWNGFGYEINDSLHRFDYTEANYMIDNNLIKLHNSLYNNNEILIDNEIAGKTLCVTGKVNIFHNRDELITAVEAKGGKVVSSVSKKTNYLVTNDPNSGSSKNIKARQLNIPIITEQQLVDML